MQNPARIESDATRPDSLACVLMRGGTSKAVFLWAADLPPRGPARDQMILRVFGSPDPRQIDGLDGTDPLTSTLAVDGESIVVTKATVDRTARRGGTVHLWKESGVSDA